MLSILPGTGHWTVELIDRSTLPKEIALTLKSGEQRLPISVSTMMGDGMTQDVSFPYWHVKSEKDGPIKPFSRTRQFTGLCGEEWVHVRDLKGDDVVSFMPSRFDFEFLDTAARRFEVSYENTKRRGPNHPARPYYLEQLTEFEKFWDILSKGLATSQIHNLIEFIEAKRMEWKVDQNKSTFEQMLLDALLNLNWRKEARPDLTSLRELCQAAVSGQLTDIVELYMSILKKKTVVDQQMGGK